MNGKKQTIVLIFILGLLVGILGGYDFGYMQGTQHERTSLQSKVTELGNNYRMLLLIEKLSTIDKLETIIIKQISSINQNTTLDVNLTKNITLEATTLAREASNMADNITCPGKVGELLKTKTEVLENLTEEMTFYLNKQDYLDMVSTYREIMITIKDIAEIINTC
ncbi:MAG: hypothetical protein F7B60_06915 [Desulfurococcales archaeon]|nr:hypothetical protein [Desulfurococcales archaeon]